MLDRVRHQAVEQTRQPLVFLTCSGPAIVLQLEAHVARLFGPTAAEFRGALAANRLGAEALEDRVVPVIYLVTVADDAGRGTLDGQSTQSNKSVASRTQSSSTSAGGAEYWLKDGIGSQTRSFIDGSPRRTSLPR